MIEKWELSYSPSGKDRGRFKIRFRGKAEEIQKLLQILPVDCEKPFHTLSQDYDCATFVHLAGESEKNQLIRTLKDFSPNGEILDSNVNFEKGESEDEIPSDKVDLFSSQQFALSGQLLNSNLNFEKFAICPQNRFAQAAAVAIAESPGKIYNPFLVFGKSGTGKTHLIQAVAHQVLERNPEAKILLISAEYFKEKTVEAIQSRCAESFRAAFEELDLLLMDDIEVIAAHPEAERELLFLINLFLAREAQLVFASKLQPRQLNQLDEKLRLRLESGLVIELSTSFAETKFAILKKQSEEMQLDLEPEVLTFLSERPCDSIDELQGILKKIHAHVHLQKGKADLESIKKLIASPRAQEAIQEVSHPPLEVSALPVETLPPEQESALSKAFEFFPKEEASIEKAASTVPQETVKATEKKSEKPVPLQPIAESELTPVKIVCFYPKNAQTDWDNTKEKLNGVIRKYRLKFKLIPSESCYDPESSDLKFSFFSETCKTEETPLVLVLGTPPGSSLEKKAFFSGLQRHFSSEKIPFYFLAWSDRGKEQKLLSFALDISLNLKGTQ